MGWARPTAISPGRFAARATLLAAAGAAVGALVALPILLTLAQMAAPFAGEAGDGRRHAARMRLATLAGARFGWRCRACR